MDVKISVLIVNLNNLDYTKQCLDDLLNQDIVFNLRLIDQNSSEIGTIDFFNGFFTKHANGEFHGKINFLEISNTGYNKPLNQGFHRLLCVTDTLGYHNLVALLQHPFDFYQLF